MATAAVLVAGCFSAPAFVPTGAPQTATLRGSEGPLGQVKENAAGSSPVISSAAAALVAGAAIGAISTRSKVARKAGRRELAIAYEESGIDLMDNGKFAQGLVGSEHAYGRYEFDPIGFSKWTELVPYFREAELKHGRIAMLAWVGLVVPDFVRIPGEAYSFEAVPRVIDAHDALAANAGP
eukprot:CAMPEP_0178402340 /NCGR_PEP_ID=MMETSP0689_2-20121128/16787_1 /TAXON_ID=160604 /ORGANISM="Amphidinium massartii, Strain CS-259" /LENGTH=180 /DNA_ID=CAMNT_0020023229 /DNA_START=113 /DNA_END=652 /DNA_ORIENTATION=-